MNYLIDSSAWIEYLSGSAEGEKVNKILEKEDKIFIIPIIISEVISFVKRKNENIETAYESMIKNAKILDITPRIAKEAGILHASMKKKINNFPLVDSLIICTARSSKAKIITRDNHFKQFKEAELL